MGVRQGRDDVDTGRREVLIDRQKIIATLMRDVACPYASRFRRTEGIDNEFVDVGRNSEAHCIGERSEQHVTEIVCPKILAQMESNSGTVSQV